MKNKEIKPYNDKGQKHGCFQEYYHNNGNLFYKGYYINGKQSALCELYSFDGTLLIKRYFIL